MRARARYMRRHEYRQSQGWRRRQGFGCIFGFLFLLIVASIVAGLASVISHLGPLQIVIAAAAAIAILAAIARGLIGAGRDLDKMLAATRRVEDGDYGARVGKTRSDLPAIRELASGFDTMAARLEADEEQRRTLLADVSHELRTPLAVITGNLEAILDGVYPADESHLTPILEETRVLERLIDDLRTLTLSEAGTLALHPEPTDPDVLVGDVVRSFTTTATRGGVTLVAEVSDDLPILDLDPVRIREVLANLVANALRHTPEGGTVTIRGQATAEEVVLERDRHRPGHRTGVAALRVRAVRQGRRVARLRAGSGHRPRARGGPRRHDLGRLTGRWRDHVPGRVAARPLPGTRYGRLIRTSSTAASTVLAPPSSAASKTIRTFSPAHGAIETLTVVQLGRSTFGAPFSCFTRVRVPSSRST